MKPFEKKSGRKEGRNIEETIQSTNNLETKKHHP